MKKNTKTHDIWVKNVYDSNKWKLWLVEGSDCIYRVSYHMGEYMCDCCIRHKRNHKLECKHIKKIKNDKRTRKDTQ